MRIPLAKKIAALLNEIDPDVVVAKEAHSRRKKNKGKRRRKLDTILQKAASKGIRCLVLTRRSVRKFFASYGQLTKHEIASFLANRYRELFPFLPPKRKCYESEDYRMSIFDATALGVAYFRRNDKRRPHAIVARPAPSQPN